MKSHWGIGAILLAAFVSPAQVERTESFTVRPKQLAPSEERIRQLELKPGFQVNVFARDLGNARMMAVAEDGTVRTLKRVP